MAKPDSSYRPSATLTPLCGGMGCEPNVERFLKVLRGEIPDRVPNYEVLICERNASHILGRPSKSSWHRETPAEDYVEICRRIGMDVMLTPISGWGLPAGHSHWDDTDTLNSAEEIEKLVAEKPPLVKYMREYLDKLEQLISAAEGTGIGVGAGPNLIFDRSVSTLSYPKFMLSLYDDMELVEAILDAYAEFARMMFAEVSKYPIAFIHTGDDVADKNGTMVRPELFRKLWFDRVKYAIEPAKRPASP